MSRRLSMVLAGAVVVVGSAVVAAPARAYDSDGYAYAAGHQIAASDISSVLGSFRKNPRFGVSPNGGPVGLCDVPTIEPSAVPTTVRYPGPAFVYATEYVAKAGTDAPVVDIHIDRYSSTKAAIRAFTLASKRIVACTGTGTQRWTDAATGTVATYTSRLSHGLEPSLTTAGGVQALYVDEDSTAATVPGDSRFVNDTYTIVALLGDVITTVTYYPNENENLTNAQRRAVADVARSVIATWQS